MLAFPAQEKGRFRVRRTILLLAAMALGLCVAAGVALAQPYGDQPGGAGVTKTCPSSCQGTTYPDKLIGTNASNHIEGLGGNESPTFGDLIQGHGGSDILYGDAGGDKIEGGSGMATSMSVSDTSKTMRAISAVLHSLRNSSAESFGSFSGVRTWWKA